LFTSFEDMPVWQKAMDLAQMDLAQMDLAQKVFSLTEGLPRKEDYGLTSQV